MFVSLFLTYSGSHLRVVATATATATAATAATAATRRTKCNL
jgi:hypothetical protein